MAVQLPSFSIIAARALFTRGALRSFWAGGALTEIPYLRNKLGIDDNIIAVVCHSRNSALMRRRLHR